MNFPSIRKLLLLIVSFLWSCALVAAPADSLKHLSNDLPDNGDYPRPRPLPWASYYRVTFDGHHPSPENQIRPIPFAITGTLYVGAIVGLHLYQSNAWWSNDRGPFHIEEDWGENLQNDKFGHFFGAYMQSYMMREAMLECGMSDEAASNWASLMGGLYSIYVEVEDGFAKAWGFSPTDAYSDLAGAAYFFAQHHIPVLRNFHEKWNYWPSKFLGSGSLPGQQRTIMDDYQGQSYWWAVDVWNLMPASGKTWWPKWLQVAVGYTARKYGIYDPTGAHLAEDPMSTTDLADTREVYLGLDYSLPNLIPKTNIPVLDWFVQTLDNFHFPAPTIRLAPSFHAYFLYPIQFRIGTFNF